MRKNIYLLATLFFLLAIFFSKNAYAKSLSIGTAPTYEMFQLEPGQIYYDNFTVWNLETSTITYYVKVSSFRQIQNQPGSAIFLSEEDDENNPYSASTWVSVEKDMLELVPNKNVTVEYTITVPKELAPGEYTAEIYFLSENPEEQDATATYTVLGSGIPILITIGDDYAESAEILNFYSTKKVYEKPNFTTLITRIQNLGDTHITPKGDIVLTNMFNQEVGRISFNETDQSILRDNTGTYESNWDLEKYINDGAIAIGPITAEAIILYRRNNPGFSVLDVTTTFWIIPWKLIILILTVIIVIYVILTLKKKKQKKTVNNNGYHYPR
ncbi:MAG: hypothetical protein PHP08_01165 [Candidatus Dojkabacteria bacterium]|nr:hypothetical protein [Candidatus Dojkabacteria bacterium]